MNAQEKLTKARAGLILDQPFFGSIALRVRLTEDSTVETGYINGQEIGYNPDWINNLSLDQVKGFLAHEVMHIACCHHTRRQDRDPKKWNIAADHAINDILLSTGFILPHNGLTGLGGPDQSAETIYNLLPEDQQGEQGEQGNNQGQDPGGCGEVRDYPGKDSQAASQAELSQAEADAKIMAAQAIQQAKAAGQLPGELARLVENILEPKVDWKEILRRFVCTNAKNDYSWTPPNRRFIHMGLYLPGIKSEQLENIIIAVDTSGSINQAVIDQFAAEISDILTVFNTSLTVLYCDTDIRHVEKFTAQDMPVKFSPVGGGGTDFRPPFDWIEKQNLMPACMIYLTDLYCNRYPNPPAYPVLWAKIGKHDGYKPPFGETIEI